MQTKNKTLILRLDPKTMDKLRAHAEAKDISVSAYVRMIIDKGLPSRMPAKRSEG